MMTVVEAFDCTQEIQHPEIDSMKFYPVIKNWSRKICPHLDNPTLQKVLVSDLTNPLILDEPESAGESMASA